LEKFNTEALVKYSNILNSLEIKNGIAIYVDGITPKAKQDIKVLQDFISVELFNYKELMFNITKHELQPFKFERLSPEEAKKFKDEYGIKFPSMKTSDMIARFYAYKRGDVIKITRRDGTIVYRIVKA
jgi:DNA-directed RNA polymerase subunit H (RpoH/RPB5)